METFKFSAYWQLLCPTQSTTPIDWVRKSQSHSQASVVAALKSSFNDTLHKIVIF